MTQHACRCVTADELRTVVSEAVKQTLTEVGMDHAQPIELQRDMSFLRDLRKARDSVAAKVIVMMALVLFTAGMGLLALKWRELAKYVPFP